MHLKVTASSCDRLNNKLYLRINFRLEVQCNSILIYKLPGAPTAYRVKYPEKITKLFEDTNTLH